MSTVWCSLCFPGRRRASSFRANSFRFASTSSSRRHATRTPSSIALTSSASSSSSSSPSPKTKCISSARQKKPSAAAILVVSDLDGTMVGDDQSTSEFRAFWEDKEEIFCESKLVYSTGRSLESFRALLEEKRKVLVEPEMLICAVGTKVYAKNKKCTTSGEEKKWIEDKEWTEQLEVGWDEETVRAGCTNAIRMCGEDSAHFRPEEEQNAHKITCGLKDEKVTAFVEELDKYLREKNVKAKIISSGTGGWKYVDCVSNQAGKLESLEFVRKKLGFEVERTVACGDSGNDTLMLSGRNLAIVVGNAQEDLVRWAEKAILEEEEEEEEIQGEEGRSTKNRVVMAKAFEARGIVEGIRAHFYS